MDSRGLHELSCKYNAGRSLMHSAMNNVIKRTLQKAPLTPHCVFEGISSSMRDFILIFVKFFIYLVYFEKQSPSKNFSSI